MKLSKKFIAALSVATMLVTAMSVIGCKKEEDDDPYEMITKVNNNYYTINHTNTAADTVQRGYKATHFQHAGALVDITFNVAKKDSADGVLGVIFGLESNTDGSKNFYVFGTRNNGSYYVSKYKNVKDLQGSNFGATEGHIYKNAEKTSFDADTATAELEIVELPTTSNIPSAKLKTTADSMSTTVFYKDTVKDANTHTYKVYILDANSTSAYTVKDSSGDLLDGNKNTVTLSDSDCVASIDYASTSTSVTQKQFALYANVYPNSSKCSATYTKAKGAGLVKGYWKVQGDFKHADVVED